MVKKSKRVGKTKNEPIPHKAPWAFLGKPRFWWIANILQVILYLGLTTAIFVKRHRLNELQEKGKQNLTIELNHLEKHGTEESREQLLHKKIQQNPNDAQGYKELAGYFEQQGFTQKALDHYRQALKLEPNQADLHLSLGLLLLSMPGHKQEAIAHLQRVLVIDPNHSKKQLIELWMR